MPSETTEHHRFPKGYQWHRCLDRTPPQPGQYRVVYPDGTFGQAEWTLLKGWITPDRPGVIPASWLEVIYP